MRRSPAGTCAIALLAVVVLACGSRATAPSREAAPAAPAAVSRAAPPAASPHPVTAPEAGAVPAGPTGAWPADCPVTAPAVAPEPTQSPLSLCIGMRRDPIRTERWYRSQDGHIWTPDWGFSGGVGNSFTPGRNKVLWIKPVGAQLEITGRRLDGDAPPLQADLPCCYPGDYQASSLVFPTTGCWEIVARLAGGAAEAGGTSGPSLRIVTYVRPSIVSTQVLAAPPTPAPAFVRP